MPSISRDACASAVQFEQYPYPAPHMNLTISRGTTSAQHPLENRQGPGACRFRHVEDWEGLPKMVKTVRLQAIDSGEIEYRPGAVRKTHAFGSILGLRRLCFKCRRADRLCHENPGVTLSLAPRVR